MKKTSDSPTAHDDPKTVPRITRGSRKWSTPDRGEKSLSIDVKQAHKYLDAILTRERAIPLSPLAQSERALARDPETVYQHAALQARVIDETAAGAIRYGRLSPSWASFDPGLPRLIKQNAGDATQVSRFDSSAVGDEIRSPYYYGTHKRLLPLRPSQKPLEKSRQTFYLARGTELGDTTGADTIRCAPMRTPSEGDQWEAMTSLLTLCASVAAVGVSAIADAIVRLAPSGDVLDAVYGSLGHSKKRKLAREIPLAETRHLEALEKAKKE